MRVNRVQTNLGYIYTTQALVCTERELSCSVSEFKSKESGKIEWRQT